MRIWSNASLGPMEKLVALAMRDGVKDIEAATGLSPALLKRITAQLQDAPEPDKSDIIDLEEHIKADQFEKFWDLYPRKRRVAKGKCHEKYKRIIRNKEATEEQIIDGLQRYIQSEDVARGFSCAPLVWLNQGRWDGVYESKGQRPEADGSSGAYERFLARRGIS